MRKSVSVKHFHDTQEGWREKAGGRHEGLEQFHRTSSFQNGGSVTFAITPPEGGFYVQDRLKRCISNNSNCKKKSRIYLRFLWRGRLYQFTCLPFGLRSSPRIFTKVLKPLLVYLRALRVRLLVYLDDILIMAATPELCLEHMHLTWQFLTDLGFLGNLKKSVLAPKQQAEYLGFIVNSIEMKLFLMEEKLLRAKLEAERLLKSNPVVKILASFLGFCQSTLPAIAVAPLHFRNLQADMIKALKGSRGGQGYRSVVCLSPEAKKELEWWRDYVKMNNGKSILPPEEQDTIFSDASKQGWGGTSESSKNRGLMELGGKVKITHKLARVKSSFPGFASFSSPTKTSACSDWHRQQNSNDLYQQIRGNPLTSSHISSLRDVELCSRQKPDFVSSVCSRRGKPDCRQKVKGVPGQPGMDAASSSVSGIAKRSWLFQYRSLCNTGEPSGSCICQLETRAWGSCHRCFQCKMGFSTGLPIPSLLYDQKVPQKNSARSGTLCPDHTSVEKQPLVSSHSISVSRATIASAKTAGSSETSRHRKDTPPVPSKKLQAGCMAHFRAKLAKEGFSQKVSDILFSSWRKKTASQYESAWKAWSGWCSEREINPFSTTLENIFEFLADLFHKGFKFRTLGVYRSAISSNITTSVPLKCGLEQQKDHLPKRRKRLGTS